MGLIADERGQSEIIGAILLVVLTLVLASLLAVYVFDIGGQQLEDRAPQVSFSFSESGGEVTATHNAGSSVAAERLEIVVVDDGTEPTAVAPGETPVAGGTTRISGEDVFGAGEVTVGDAGTVAEDFGDADSVRIVYVDPNTNRGTTLGRFIG